MKVCAKCGETFSTRALVDGKRRWLNNRRFCLACSPFGQHNTSRDPICGLDAAEAAARRRARRAASWVRYQSKRRRSFKVRLLEMFGARCVQCGYMRSPAALDFHHPDPTKKEFRISSFNGSWARMVAEAAKCHVLCANCHAMHHAGAARDGRAHAVVEWRRRAKHKLVQRFGGRCVQCGFDAHVAALQFHHRDPATKLFAIGADGVPRAWERLLTESAKCDLFCANCHREAHAARTK